MKADFYRSPAPHWWIMIPFGLCVCMLSWYDPENLRKMWYIGPMSRIGHYLGSNYNHTMMIVNILAWGAHFGEALYARYLCSQKGITHPGTVNTWVAQTFILGAPSLIMLIKYKPRIN